ncbi:MULTISPECIES: MaoC/PaaZ C-terminal domain-containing protein [Saccharopolyspora]|uniref:MaoC family dehydratase n=1 Tax=Saccharopolyspora gregorii TaxID=33914 RepID=A0ABP6RTT6_9PSEU|nr:MULTISPECIES: MaoC/PaaZ C-terminal domain-containing protein [Saccharopolyspora]MCA1187146.1 acyl dehydratase [Saccharopolyspora sp. 6T]MCA1227383.1 acyl dehydratase [Saccharopolyspora sp. 6M]MCA1280414.1 acyl dehydratase [Saccharopolyspora sp. 7B]
MTTLPRTRTAPEVRVGESLPEVRIEMTPTFIVSSALATRDFQDVHHDRDRAQAGGSADIFVNILTSTGLAQRYVTDWAGPEALVRGVSVRLGAPCYAHDTLALFGQVLSRADDGEFEVEVLGRNGLGEHLRGTVRVALPEGAS